MNELAPDLQLAALTNLGLMYAQGQGVEQDFGRALDCYRQAAEHGVPQAQSNLAVMYAHGQGVAQDFAQAHKWYRAAAEQGLPYAQTNLAFDYVFKCDDDTYVDVGNWLGVPYGDGDFTVGQLMKYDIGYQTWMRQKGLEWKPSFDEFLRMTGQTEAASPAVTEQS